MTEVIEFPKLGWEFSISDTAFSIGGFNIYWYGIIITFGIVLAMIYCYRRAKSFGVNPDHWIDVVIGGMIGGVIGARIYFVVLQWETFQNDLLSIFNLRIGGLAFYGGLIGAVLAGLLVCKWRKIKTAPVLDMAGLGFLIGQGIGRWGNFFNTEAFGGNTNLPWGMTSDSIQRYLKLNQTELTALGMNIDPTVPVHPTFFYESLWCILGFILIHFLSKRRKFDGQVFLEYIIWYSTGRFFIEGLRTDSLILGNTIRMSQLLSLLMLIAAIIIMVVSLSKIRRDDTIPLATLYVNTDEWKERLIEIQSIEKKSNDKKEDAEETQEEKSIETDDTNDMSDEHEEDDKSYEETDSEPSDGNEIEQANKPFHTFIDDEEKERIIEEEIQKSKKKKIEKENLEQNKENEEDGKDH